MWSCVEYAASNLTAVRRQYQIGLDNPSDFDKPSLGCRPGSAPTQVELCKKAIQGEIDKFTAKLEAYQKGRGSYLAADKTPSLLSRLLVAENLLDAINEAPRETRMIDLRLDGTGFDSTSRQVLFWKTTTFSANAMAHYYLFELSGKTWTPIVSKHF